MLVADPFLMQQFQFNGGFHRVTNTLRGRWTANVVLHQYHHLPEEVTSELVCHHHSINGGLIEWFDNGTQFDPWNPVVCVVDEVLYSYNIGSEAEDPANEFWDSFCRRQLEPTEAQMFVGGVVSKIGFVAGSYPPYQLLTSTDHRDRVVGIRLVFLDAASADSA